eukprot:sb/3465503/
MQRQWDTLYYDFVYWCDSCETVKQCSFLLRDMIKVCLKIGLLTEQDCPELITNEGEEATSLPPTENAITAEPPTISADDLPDIITEKVIQQILTEAHGPAMSTVAMATEQSPEKVAMTTEQSPEDEGATDFPYGVTEADGDFRNPVVDTWTADPTRKTCSIFGRGDIFVSTFNMETYAFSGDCTYVLSVDCTDRRRDWLVYGTIGQCPQGKCLNGLTIFYKGLSLLVDRAWTVSYQGNVLKLLEDYPVYFYEFQLDFDGSNLRVPLGCSKCCVGSIAGDIDTWCDPGVYVTNGIPGCVCVCGVVDSYIDIVESWKVDRLKTCPETKAPTTTKQEMCGDQPRNLGKLYCQAVFEGDQGCSNKRCCPSEAEVQGYTLLEEVAPWHEEYDGMKM